MCPLSVRRSVIQQGAMTVRTQRLVFSLMVTILVVIAIEGLSLVLYRITTGNSFDRERDAMSRALLMLLFDGVRAPTYSDNCCHLNQAGNDRVARRLAKILRGRSE